MKNCPNKFCSFSQRFCDQTKSLFLSLKPPTNLTCWLTTYCRACKIFPLSPDPPYCTKAYTPWVPPSLVQALKLISNQQGILWMSTLCVWDRPVRRIVDEDRLARLLQSLEIVGKKVVAMVASQKTSEIVVNNGWSLKKTLENIVKNQKTMVETMF